MSDSFRVISVALRVMSLQITRDSRDITRDITGIGDRVTRVTSPIGGHRSHHATTSREESLAITGPFGRVLADRRPVAPERGGA